MENNYGIYNDFIFYLFSIIYYRYMGFNYRIKKENVDIIWNNILYNHYKYCSMGDLWSKLLDENIDPIVFEKYSNEEYSYIVYDGKEYIPYSSISPTERDCYLGYVKDDEQDEIYTCKKYSEEEWLISYLNSGLMNYCMLLKEKNVTYIPDRLSSEYEWNKDKSTKSYIPDSIKVAENSSVSDSNIIVAIDNSSGEDIDLEFNRSPENVTIEVLEDTITKELVEILITDNNENSYGWGIEFRVQEKVDGEWKDLKDVSSDLYWNAIAYELNEDKQLTQRLNIKNYYGTLKNGIYRIVKPVYDNGYIYIYSNEFEIK